MGQQVIKSACIVTVTYDLAFSLLIVSLLFQAVMTYWKYIHWVKVLAQDGECAVLFWVHLFTYLEERGLPFDHQTYVVI